MNDVHACQNKYTKLRDAFGRIVPYLSASDQASASNNLRQLTTIVIGLDSGPNLYDNFAEHCSATKLSESVRLSCEGTQCSGWRLLEATAIRS